MASDCLPWASEGFCLGYILQKFWVYCHYISHFRRVYVGRHLPSFGGFFAFPWDQLAKASPKPSALASCLGFCLCLFCLKKLQIDLAVLSVRLVVCLSVGLVWFGSVGWVWFLIVCDWLPIVGRLLPIWLALVLFFWFA